MPTNIILQATPLIKKWYGDLPHLALFSKVFTTDCKVLYTMCQALQIKSRNTMTMNDQFTAIPMAKKWGGRLWLVLPLILAPELHVCRSVVADKTTVQC